MRRRAMRVLAVVAIGMLLGPALAAPAEAARKFSPGPQRVHRAGHGSHHIRAGHPHFRARGFRGHGHFRGHHHGHHHHHHGHGGSKFILGFGVGAIATAPWWAVPRAYPVPVSPYPVYAAPAYSYPAYGAPAYGSPPYAPPPPATGQPAYPTAPPVGGAPAGTLPATPEPLSPPAGQPESSSTPGSSGAEVSGSGGSAAPAPGDAAASAGAARCETVTVVGHWQTRIYPDGQRMTVWVPTNTRSVCR